MGIYQACPVCHGQGHLNKPPWIAGDQETWTSSTTETYECRVCRGRGIIPLPDQHPHDQRHGHIGQGLLHPPNQPGPGELPERPVGGL